MSNHSVEIDISAEKPEQHYWRDLWRYRELFLILAWRDIAVRYKQTALGVLWAVIPPILTTLIMTAVFERVADLPSVGTVPYSVMVFVGLLPWQLFASALGAGGNSLVGSAHLISKVYFPRLIVPGSAIVASFVDFLISLVILAALMIWHQTVPSPQIIALPGFALLAVLAALGPGLLLAALNVTYRDFRFLIPFIIQFGLYLSPVGFSAELVRQKLGDDLYLLYALNPMVAVIEGFRWSILGQTAFPVVELALGTVTMVVALFLGLKVFRSTERSFADVI